MRLLKLVPDNTNLPFVSLRFWAFGLTALLTVLATAMVLTRGLNLGVDFVGGLMIEAKFQQPPHLDQVRQRIDALHAGDALLQQFGGADTVSIRLPLPKSSDQGATNELIKQVRATLEQGYPGVNISRADTVSGKVSDELVLRG
jgi:preprotein translocase subunit SecF